MFSFLLPVKGEDDNTETEEEGNRSEWKAKMKKKMEK
jgi:hypothetical protein